MVRTDPGYARLVGRKGGKFVTEALDVMIHHLPATLGKAPDQACGIGGSHGDGRMTKHGQFVNLGSMKMLSREHCKIHWDPPQQSFVLDVLSKNGVRVNKKPHSKGSKVLLPHKSRLRIGTFRCFFTIPKNAKLTTGKFEMSAKAPPSCTEMIRTAFNSGRLPIAINNGGVLQKDIIAFILSRYPLKYDDTSKMQSLINGVNTSLQKNYLLVPNADSDVKSVENDMGLVRWRQKEGKGRPKKSAAVTLDPSAAQLPIPLPLTTATSTIDTNETPGSILMPAPDGTKKRPLPLPPSSSWEEEEGTPSKKGSRISGDSV